MVTKFDRTVTYLKRILPIKLLRLLTAWSETVIMSMATKFGKRVTYHDRFLHIKSHGHFIT